MTAAWDRAAQAAPGTLDPTDQDAGLAEILRRIRRVSEMSAEIMRDPERTGRWEGAEKVSRQFDRLAQLAIDGAHAERSKFGEALRIPPSKAGEEHVTVSPPSPSRRVRTYTHHALWGDLLGHVWSAREEKFAVALVERIADALDEDATRAESAKAEPAAQGDAQSIADTAAIVASGETTTDLGKSHALGTAPEQGDAELMANMAVAIHNARWAHPEYPREPDPFGRDKVDKEYAERLARAAHAVVATRVAALIAENARLKEKLSGVEAENDDWQRIANSKGWE